MASQRNNKSQKIDSLNPLLQNFSFTVTQLEDKTTYQNNDGVLLPKLYHLERDQHTKVFINQYNRKKVSNLSNGAKSLLLWLIFELKPGTDQIEINKIRYMKENNIKSINTFKKAIQELTDNFIIAPAKKLHFINPRILFNGSRIKTYQNNINLYKPNKTVK
jgi:hypothetical protein